MANLPCPPELWPAFSVLLDEVLELPDADRARWLAGLGPEHADVKPWVAKILASTAGTVSTEFMQRPALGADTLCDFAAGQRVGPYVLKGPLGSGGMGEVWLASRTDGNLNREVALKLPHAHLMAGVLRRRFERERDILAGLSHPHIAQLYDAGVADSEHPYLAMEFIDGISINEHCRNECLSLEQRLDLFRQILDAVGYAHSRLIAHRDLKPSNILVTREQRVKLLDFGIAKLIQGESEAGLTQLTRIGSALATPGYAAPEQLAGAPITVAVDLYALGVILHELLTGQRPFQGAHSMNPAHRIAPRASTQIEAGHADQVGRLDLRQLRRALHGDLDAIIAKALEADPERRYRSAEVFALDLQMSREHRPISARRIGAATLALKFIRRHRLVVAMTITLIAVLIAGSMGIAWQAVRAEREARRATTIKDFLVGVFRASDPRIGGDKPRGEITARELLDVSAAKIESGFAQQPDTQIELLGVTADVYRELDETQRSTALFQRETELSTRYLGLADAHTIDGLLGQAYNADADGDDSRALVLLQTADPLIRQARLDRTAIRARWLLMRGEALMDDARRSDEAQASLEAAVALFKAIAPLDARYPDALTDLGLLALEQTKFGDSADYYRRAIATAEPKPSFEGNLVLANAGLALALKRLGDFAGAARAFERGTEIAERTYGRNSQNYWAIASDWAQFRYERGDREAALAAFDALNQAVPADRMAFHNATNALEASQVLRKFGHCLAGDGQGALAVRMVERAQSLFDKSAQHPADAALLQIDLGKAYEAAGRMTEARAAFFAALNAYTVLGAADLQLAAAHERWARFLLSQKDADAAETEFNEALRLSTGHFTEPAVYAQAGLAAVALLRGDASLAQSASAEAMHELDHLEGYFDVRVRPYVWGIRARSLRMTAADGVGRAVAELARDAAHEYFSPQSPLVAEADMTLKSFRLPIR